MRSHVAAALTLFCSFGLFGSVCSAGVTGDTNGDGRVGIAEALYALKVASDDSLGVPQSCTITGESAWQGGQSYLACDVVQSNGSYFMCTQNHTSTLSNAPPDTTNWTTLALQGEKGDTGDIGPAGPEGPAGGTDGTAVYITGSSFTLNGTNEMVVTTGPVCSITLASAVSAGAGRTVRIYSKVNSFTVNSASGDLIWDPNGISNSSLGSRYTLTITSDGIDSWFQLNN